MSKLTDEELEEQLAIKGMGWDVSGAGTNTFYLPGAREFVVFQRDWHPRTDLNQAAMLAQKVADDKGDMWELNYWPMAKQEAKYQARFGGLNRTMAPAGATALCRAVAKTLGIGE